MSREITGKTPDPREVYGDIIDHPHWVSPKHPPMSLYDRAAQFAPFAALSGYSSVIEEISRHTEEKPILDESAKQEINRGLLYLKKHPDRAEPVRVDYFLPDLKKSGGSFETARDEENYTAVFTLPVAEGEA